jgi:hypothetical protein
MGFIALVAVLASVILAVAIAWEVTGVRWARQDDEDARAIPAPVWLSPKDTSGNRKPHLYCGDGVWKRLLTEDDLPALVEEE